MTEPIDMGRVNEWLDTVRNTFINASELAKSVASLQEQVNSMSLTLDGLRRTNTTLEENLAWSRSERERLEADLRRRNDEVTNLTYEVTHLDKECSQYKAIADERASIITTLKADNDAIAFKNLELEEECKELRKQVDAIAAVLGGGPKPDVSVKVVEDKTVLIPAKEPEIVPFTHPVTGVIQGRDTVTQQFKPAPATLEEVNKPWWEQEDKPASQGSGF